MPSAVSRRGLRLVDVRAYDTVQIAPANDKSHCYTTFVDAFRVVGDPDDGVGNARVDAKGAEKGACVADGGIGCSEEHGEADHTEN